MGGYGFFLPCREGVRAIAIAIAVAVVGSRRCALYVR
jgi:hypothetical protein